MLYSIPCRTDPVPRDGIDLFKNAVILVKDTRVVGIVRVISSAPSTGEKLRTSSKDAATIQGIGLYA